MCVRACVRVLVCVCACVRARVRVRVRMCHTVLQESSSRQGSTKLTPILSIKEKDSFYFVTYLNFPFPTYVLTPGRHVTQWHFESDRRHTGDFVVQLNSLK